MDEIQALAAISAMSNRDRLRVVRHLVQAGPAGLSAGDIAASIGASPSRTSFHLNELSDAGLLISDRDARRIFYRVDFAAMGGLLQFLLEDCCQNHPDVRACCAPKAC